MINVLDSDLTIFDDQLFFYFRNKYKPEVSHYLDEKHYFESENKLPFDIKKIQMYTWNTLLVKEIVTLGYTREHLANHYNSLFDKISKAKNMLQLQQLEKTMFSKYIDIIINLQESTDHLLVNKILHFLHMHIEDEVSIEILTQALNISKSHASKIFKAHMDTTIIKYSKHLKVERAKALLRTELSITEIGELLGFYDQSHFYHTFKQMVGVSPSDFRTKRKSPKA